MKASRRHAQPRDVRAAWPLLKRLLGQVHRRALEPREVLDVVALLGERKSPDAADQRDAHRQQPALA